MSKSSTNAISNGWETARQVADWLPGLNRKFALRQIDRAEAAYKKRRRPKKATVKPKAKKTERKLKTPRKRGK